MPRGNSTPKASVWTKMCIHNVVSCDSVSNLPTPSHQTLCVAIDRTNVQGGPARWSPLPGSCFPRVLRAPAPSVQMQPPKQYMLSQGKFEVGDVTATRRRCPGPPRRGSWRASGVQFNPCEVGSGGDAGVSRIGASQDRTRNNVLRSAIECLPRGGVRGSVIGWN